MLPLCMEGTHVEIEGRIRPYVGRYHDVPVACVYMIPERESCGAILSPCTKVAVVGHMSLPYISTCVPSIHLYMRPFHTSLHASLPYISTCVPPIHLYMRPFHTSLNASLPYISTCVPFIHVGIIFTRARPPRRDVEMWKGRML